MKKTIFGIAFLLFVSQSKAQKFGFQLEGQGKSIISSTWLLNNNISDKGDDQEYAPGWGTTYGVGINGYFNSVGLGVEILGGTHKGAYKGTILGTDYTSEVQLKQFQIPILLKLRGESGGYFEIGPQFNIISSARYTRDGLGNETKDVKSNYENYTSVVMGFGANIQLSKSIPLGLMMGMRLNYGFTDAKGVDALGFNLNNSLLYPTYEKTMAVSAGLQLGLSYKFN
jgi:hypothetical protein